MNEEEKIYVELRNISKNYDNVKVLNNISLKIPYNSYFCICGPTGSGKSTLLKILAGLVDPDEGEIYIDGKLMNKIPPEDRGIGMLFEHQTYALFPHYSIYENVIYPMRVRGEPKEVTRKTAGEMLELVLLADRANDFPDVMSGGMKQRVALARALMTGSKLLVLDEPLSALDAKIRLNLRKELVSMVRSLGDLTVIHVTQDVEEALMVSDYIAVLYFGDILQIGTPEELYSNPNCLEVCNFLSYSNFFEGTVIDLDEGKAFIKLENVKIQVRERAFSIGDKVVIAVRASDLMLDEKGTETPNQITGKIIRSQFIHGFMRYEVEITNGKIVIAELPYKKDVHFEERETVIVSFLPEDTLVFPHPGGALRHIIEK
ncbi:MAG: ABC transporter ATP-binding protein [Candidatus Helarchaeota archaeon]